MIVTDMGRNQKIVLSCGNIWRLM